ncbi:aldehyde oxidase 1-like [Bufo gargarizans]|uniref:aldehyde oxidase 1-like n=1 Tax=Bufo gargarizans TaxID=30331 RepID=UPI001CF5FBB4|nr:aldehyde oxidase 1-like [Bufo gargarizans]
MSHLRCSDELVFFVNGKKIVERNADPEIQLLPYLRKHLRLTGTKSACGVGGCGACTVMVSSIHPVSKKILHYPVTACLTPICSLHGMAVTTTEGIGNSVTRLHPVQERLAKAHGSQCGFCSPGMVMSMYSLLRNNPEPTIQEIMAYLSGNLCRCTGYRPILDGFRTFDKNCCKSDEENMLPEMTSPKLFNEQDLLPLDSTQELIFPPELMLMLNNPKKMMTFHGERITWYSPSTLGELLELKKKFPKAPLVVGNTTVGRQMKLEGVTNPVIISPLRIIQLHAISTNDQGLVTGGAVGFSQVKQHFQENVSKLPQEITGLVIGAAVSLSQVKELLQENVSKLPQEKTKLFQSLLQHLSTLAGEQIRCMASLGGHVMSKAATSDLNPILAAGGAMLNLASKGSSRTIPLNDVFFTDSSTVEPGEVLLSVLIPYSGKNQVVSAFRQALSEENSFAIVNAGMQVQFNNDTDVIKEIAIFYGGVGSSTVSAKETCQALIGRHWNDEMLSEACRMVLNEITIPPSAPEGKVEYKRSLIISFLFKFYLQVLQVLDKPITSSVKASEHLSAIRGFETTVPKTVQLFQEVTTKQPVEDPVGYPVVHLSGITQATGEAIYVDDMPRMDQELFLAFATSKKAHAKIVSIDASDALKSPGVVDIIRAKDVPGLNEISTQGPLFSEEEVICVGQIICAVVADTPEHARRAAAKVKISYKDQEPLVLTVEDAIKHNSFFEPTKQILHGNVEEAFKMADHIIEGEVHIGGQEHFYLETNCVLVVPKGEAHEFDVYVSSQDPATSQFSVASVLNVPSNRIMSHTKRVGGAFGGKTTKPGIFASAAAVAAQKTKRPIRCVLERNEDMLMTAGRHPFKGIYKVGCMNDGKIVGADVTFYANAGCTPDESILVIIIAMLKMDNAYDFSNLNCRAKACKTNLPSNTAYRGFGFPQTGLSSETMLDAVARKLGLPPDQVREKNMYKGIGRTYYKQEFNATNLTRCWNECLEMSSYTKRRTEIQKFNKENYWKKKGIAIIPIKFAVGYIEKMYHQASALVHIYRDGKVLISHSGVELGQGLHTKIIQIASKELKIPMSYIYISGTTTVTVPNSLPTAGSIGTNICGLAVKYACETLCERLEPFVKKNPNGKWEEWVLGAFSQKVSLSATGFFRGYNTEMDWEKGEGNITPYYIFGAACSEIELDCLTGGHKNLRTDMVVDAGESINPGVDIGQLEGAFVQGLGLYTIEELHYSPQGDMYTLGPDKYKIPGVRDIPSEFNVSLLASSNNPYTIYSAKGLGEISVFLGCSVFFAIKDAVDSARQERGLPMITLNSPMTPEKIRMACEDHLTNMIPRDKPGTFVPWSIDVTS